LAISNSSPVTNSSRNRPTELVLLLGVWVIVAGFYVLASLGSHGAMPTNVYFFLAAMVGISLAMHLIVRWLAPKASQILLPVSALLNGIGFIEISRWNPPLASQQALWYAVSAIAVAVTLFFVRNARDLDRYRFISLSTAILLMLLPLVPKIGVNNLGARLWVSIGPISFQPIEIAKILLAFFFASYFAANRTILSTPTQRLAGRLIVPPRVLLPIFAAWGIAVAILLAENDIGFAMMLFVLFFSLLWLATGRASYMALGAGLFAGGGYSAYLLFPQVQSRVSLWLNPWTASNLARTHQLIDGWFSLAAGGVTGTGLGLGQSGGIPFITSDMIFAAIGEELGLLGVILLVSLFAVMVGEGFAIAQRAHSDFVRLAATGLTATVGLQAFFIMGGVLRLVPFTGITLPFVAYGGSSLVANYIVIALLLRISDENANERRGGEVVALSFAEA